MKDLESKKLALAAESEVYRQALKLELQNLRLYGMRAKKRFTSFGRFNPLLMLALSLGSSFLKRRLSLPRLVMAAFVGWQLYQRISTVWGGLFSSAFGSRRSRKKTSEDRARTATI